MFVIVPYITSYISSNEIGRYLTYLNYLPQRKSAARGMIVIGIKYGPEGRVANKAEELMSTRSRRKAPRTGWHQRRSFIRHTARQDILNHYYSMIRNWIEMNYMLDIGYYDRSTCLGIADCLNVEQSLTQFDHRRQTWNSERGRSHERSRSPQFKAVWLQIVSHIRKTLKHFLHVSCLYLLFHGLFILITSF